MNTGHIGLNVTDLSRSERFYSEALGLTPIGGSKDGDRRYTFLGDGTRLVLTLWEQSNGRFDAATPGLHHLSFQVDSADAVRQAEERLRALGAKFVHEGLVAHAEGADSGGIFFEDPDGTRLEIFTTSGVKGAPVADGPACGFF